MNQTIGHIQCPICNTAGEVRRYKQSARGSMYWACQCGQIRPVKSQIYIQKNAEFYPDAGELVPESGKLFTPKPAPEKPVTEKPEAAKPKPPVTNKPAPRPAAAKPAAPVTKKPEPEKKATWGFFE